MPVTLCCETCGDEYETSPSKAERTDSNYCSTDCFGESIGDGKVEVDCECCNTTFERYASNIKGKTFCSVKCHNDYQQENGPKGEQSPAWQGGKETAECDCCGETFDDYPSRIGRGENVYCSQECAGKDKRAEAHHATIEQARRSYRWANVREKILTRDKHRCQDCGYDQNLHVHHITPLSEGGAPFDSDNLKTLCETCHLSNYHKGRYL